MNYLFFISFFSWIGSTFLQSPGSSCKQARPRYQKLPSRPSYISPSFQYSSIPSRSSCIASSLQIFLHPIQCSNLPVSLLAFQSSCIASSLPIFLHPFQCFNLPAMILPILPIPSNASMLNNFSLLVLIFCSTFLILYDFLV